MELIQSIRQPLLPSMNDADVTSSNSPDDIEEEYVVEAIRGWRYNLAERRKEFRIKWENYPEEDNTWEPEENLQHAPELLQDFRDTLSDSEKRYFYADEPDKLTGFQRNAQFVRYVGCDGPHDSDSEDSAKVKKQRFYILAVFDDSGNAAEEITLGEFIANKPEEALKFCEERLIYRSDPEDSSQDSSEA